MANPVPAAAAMQEALNNHERMRKSTQLPLFHGRPEVDTVSARLMVDRVTEAARIGGWSQNARAPSSTWP